MSRSKYTTLLVSSVRLLDTLSISDLQLTQTDTGWLNLVWILVISEVSELRLKSPGSLGANWGQWCPEPV